MPGAMAEDVSYATKIQNRAGGLDLVIASGGQLSILPGASFVQQLVIKTANYTVTAAESGATFLADAADIVFTLPSTVAGLRYRFILSANGLSVGTGLSLSPAAVDAVFGNGLTNVDNKDLINSGASDRIGDAVEIVGDGRDGWYIQSLVGTWAKEA